MIDNAKTDDLIADLYCHAK